MTRPHVRRMFCGVLAEVSRTEGDVREIVPTCAAPDFAEQRAELRPKTGAWLRVTDDAGDIISDTHEPRRELHLNIGDAAIVTAADLAEDVIGYVEAVSIDALGVPTVQLIRGELPAGAVYILPARKARPAKRSKPRGPLALPGARLAAIVRRKRLEIGGGS